jgi:hypothetical protein
MGCCDDPTEPVKIKRTDVARIKNNMGITEKTFYQLPRKSNS